MKLLKFGWVVKVWVLSWLVVVEVVVEDISKVCM